MSCHRNTRVVKSVWVVLGLTASLTAQQSPGSDPASLLRADAQHRTNWATEWLHSEDPVRVAWGAWLAREDRQTTLIPLLLGKLGEYQSAGELSLQTIDRDRHDALLVVLDALIGLGAVVPAEEAHKLYPEFAAQSIVLLVRSPVDAQSALLDIFHVAKANWIWLAAGNALLKNRTPGFTALLLSRFTQHMEVSVISKNGIRAGFGGGTGDCDFAHRAPRAGWPGVGQYLLTQFPDRIPWLTATFLVGGETPVYYLRADPGNYGDQPDFPGGCYDGNRDQYRAQYLTKLMERSFQLIILNPYPQVTIYWKGETDYRERLIAAVAEQRTAFGRAVASLQESVRVLTSEEAAMLEPRLEIVIHDERTDQSAPLPAVMENDRTVAVRVAFTTPLD